MNKSKKSSISGKSSLRHDRCPERSQRDHRLSRRPWRNRAGKGSREHSRTLWITKSTIKVNCHKEMIMKSRRGRSGKRSQNWFRILRNQTRALKTPQRVKLRILLEKMHKVLINNRKLPSRQRGSRRVIRVLKAKWRVSLPSRTLSQQVRLNRCNRIGPIKIFSSP